MSTSNQTGTDQTAPETKAGTTFDLADPGILTVAGKDYMSDAKAHNAVWTRICRTRRSGR